MAHGKIPKITIPVLEIKENGTQYTYLFTVHSKVVRKLAYIMSHHSLALTLFRLGCSLLIGSNRLTVIYGP